MPTTPSTPAQNRPAQPRLLSGTGGRRGDDQTRTATEATSFTATLPYQRPQPTPARPAATPAAASGALPRWTKGFVIGGVLLAVAMPASVLMSRSMLVQEALAEQSSSKAAMICTAGEGKAVDDSSLLGWLFGGSYFSCGDWETREARVQRDRDRDQANYMARERAKQGLN
ncbi:hypothetical protein J2X20_001370 [Pelomonas saccharophila]|uniref:Uncharacterized protein n=1 Tax=Roseateles saccharophilus TaxID=304 RepID=A0ABU1YIR0_ROSSA|nr:hypothetical protein [Roseateles saccharophilus]MDR7268741.1 hypothetical protein [Roseateles saccharophilus]